MSVDGGFAGGGRLEFDGFAEVEGPFVYLPIQRRLTDSLLLLPVGDSPPPGCWTMAGKRYYILQKKKD
jgi:hypothetical protein